MNDVTKDLLEALKAVDGAYHCGEDLNIVMDQVRSAIACGETALAEPQPNADGWIPWVGGECPVDPDTLVDVKVTPLVAAELLESRYAKCLEWSHEVEFFASIIAYRVVEAPDARP